MNSEYDVLYNNFYNTWQDINDLSLEYTPEKTISLYELKLLMMFYLYFQIYK